MSRLLTVYRVLAYVTGLGLIALVFVAMPLEYIGHMPEPTSVIGQIHGFLYAAYFVVVLLLGYVRRWSVLRTALVVVAGTVPFAAFVAERRIVAYERARDEAAARPGR